MRVINFLEEPDVWADLLELASKLGGTVTRTNATVKRYQKADGAGSLAALILCLIALMGFSVYLIYMGYDWLQIAKTFEEPGVVIDNSPGIWKVALGTILVVTSLVFLGFTIHDGFKKNDTSK